MARRTVQRIPRQKRKIFPFAEKKCYSFSLFVTLDLPLQSLSKQFLQNKVASILL